MPGIGTNAEQICRRGRKATQRHGRRGARIDALPDRGDRAEARMVRDRIPECRRGTFKMQQDQVARTRCGVFMGIEPDMEPRKRLVRTKRQCTIDPRRFDRGGGSGIGGDSTRRVGVARNSGSGSHPASVSIVARHEGQPMRPGHEACAVRDRIGQVPKHIERALDEVRGRDTVLALINRLLAERARHAGPYQSHVRPVSSAAGSPAGRPAQQACPGAPGDAASHRSSG